MPKRSWYIKETELDNYQIKIIQRKVDSSFIVKGCAGSGKSILALWKAKQIQETNLGSFYVIIFTKALRQFFKDGIESVGLKSDRVLYFEQWKNKGFPHADFIIVDEVQDFNREEIEHFKEAAQRCLILYGDNAQQIFKGLPGKENLLKMENIASILGFNLIPLVINHRLPRKIARLASKISSDDEAQYLPDVCESEGTNLPYILKYPNLNSQLDAIMEIVKSRGLVDVGILFSKNEYVRAAFEYYTGKGFTVEARYSIDRNDNRMSLDFKSDNPKLINYHSAKGLQFEAVFIPRCNDEDEKWRDPLYVAITRTYDSLFIMHSGDLTSFFDDVPESLFETTLVKQTTRRL